jgi:hypothetical protein
MFGEVASDGCLLLNERVETATADTFACQHRAEPGGGLSVSQVKIFRLTDEPLQGSAKDV